MTFDSMASLPGTKENEERSKALEVGNGGPVETAEAEGGADGE